jgi:SAM-dependent methyltransferase
MMIPLSANLGEWFNTPLGEYLRERELSFYDNAVADIFGFNALQLGLPEIDFLRANRIPYRLMLGRGVGCALRSEFHELPIASQSVDLVALPHVFEFSPHPHQILREVERVLMPEGQVVISAFNPWSLWGAKRRWNRTRGDYPWCGRFISLPRLKDWLALMGLEMVAGRVCCYAPPFTQEKWLRRFRFMEPAGDRWWALAGGVYFLQARKRVQGLRLIMPNWRDRLAARKALAPAPQKHVTQREKVHE